MSVAVCRLCAAPVRERFRLPVRRQYDVAYSVCSGCGSLQTDTPHWLNEVYSTLDPALDVGFLRRNVLTAALTAEVLTALGIGPEEPCLDWGSGPGLFCRMMRDASFHFFGYDKYAKGEYIPLYRIGEPAGKKFRAVTAFEVFEHLPHPATELDALFALDPSVLIFTTELYSGQDSDWWYLDHVTGQHVFFYSQTALQWIAAQRQYRLVPLGMAWAFVRPDCQLESGPWVERGIDRLAAALKTDPWSGVSRDYAEYLRLRDGA